MPAAAALPPWEHINSTCMAPMQTAPHARAVRRSVSRDRGLRAVLEAAGSICVLFYLCWKLAPVLATVIVGTGMAAAVYRKVARGIETKLSKALGSLSRVAGQAFSNIRTVRAFAGALHACAACVSPGRHSATTAPSARLPVRRRRLRPRRGRRAAHACA